MRRWITSIPCLSPLWSAIDTFCSETPLQNKQPPFIRDCVDLKRWMMLVIIALSPTIFMALWNSGVQAFVYGSHQLTLVQEYIQASRCLSGYIKFVTTDQRYLSILLLGAKIFLPLVAISYTVGGIIEMLFAFFRKEEIAEGFLVTGMLYPLILPSTIPYWMAALGVAVGIILSKELFGGTGRNIMNPALVCRALLFFTFPANMTGEVWVGKHSSQIEQSILSMNQSSSLIDGISQASILTHVTQAPLEIKRIHIEYLGQKLYNQIASHPQLLTQYEQRWDAQHPTSSWQEFVTAPTASQGLGLPKDHLPTAVRMTQAYHGVDLYSNGNLFMGNRIGSMGETSVVAALLGACFLIVVGIASWRTMLSVVLGVLLTATAFYYGSHIGLEDGLWNPAKFAFPAYKHLLMGGLSFGLVYMATDPVSSPTLKSSQWIYGLFIGTMTIVIRCMNPAYAEAVMLAILLGNVFAPLIDHYMLRIYKRNRVKQR